MRTARVALAAAFTLLLSVAAVAHEGHPHRFLGVLSAVQGSQIEVKTTDGKLVVFTLDQKTVIQQGKAKADVKGLKIGERIVVSALPVAAGKVMTAINVQLRAPVPAPARSSAAK